MSDFASVIARVTTLLAGLSDDDRARAAASLSMMFGGGSKDPPSKGATRQRRYRERHSGVTSDVTSDAQSVTRNVTSDVTRDVTGDVTRDVTSSPSLHSPSPPPSGSLDLEALPRSRATGDVTDARANAPAGQVEPINPVPLVEHFVQGVHSAGCDVYAMPAQGEFRALGKALLLHCAKAPGSWLELCRKLGTRWVAYCGGQPGNGLAAKDWLSKGAPETRPGPARTRLVQPPSPTGRAWRAGDGT